MENMQVLQKGKEMLPWSSLAFMSSFRLSNGIPAANKYLKDKASTLTFPENKINKNFTSTFFLNLATSAECFSHVR